LISCGLRGVILKITTITPLGAATDGKHIRDLGCLPFQRDYGSASFYNKNIFGRVHP